jgi:hypothetical protein
MLGSCAPRNPSTPSLAGPLNAPLRSGGPHPAVRLENAGALRSPKPLHASLAGASNAPYVGRSFSCA